MKVLVTGGAGFIGSHIVDASLREGFEVKVLDDFSAGRKGNLEPVAGRIELIDGSLNDKSALGNAVHGVDRVFHLAALTSVVESIRNPEKTHEVNITGTEMLLDSAKEAGVKRAVFASSASVYGDAKPPLKESLDTDPISPYGVSKVEGENLMKKFNAGGLETVSLRFFNVYGPRQPFDSPYSGVITVFINKLLQREKLKIFGDGEQTRDFIFVEDVAAASLLAAKSPDAAGETFNIATGVGTSINTLLKELSDITGTGSQPEYSEKREGDIDHSYADITKASEVLAFEPKTPLREGLQRTVDWYMR